MAHIDDKFARIGALRIAAIDHFVKGRVYYFGTPNRIIGSIRVFHPSEIKKERTALNHWEEDISYPYVDPVTRAISPVNIQVGYRHPSNEKVAELVMAALATRLGTGSCISMGNYEKLPEKAHADVELLLTSSTLESCVVPPLDDPKNILAEVTQAPREEKTEQKERVAQQSHSLFRNFSNESPLRFPPEILDNIHPCPRCGGADVTPVLLHTGAYAQYCKPCRTIELIEDADSALA